MLLWFFFAKSWLAICRRPCDFANFRQTYCSRRKILCVSKQEHFKHTNEAFKLLYLIHSADPQSRPVGIIVFAHVVCPSPLFKIYVGLAEWIIDETLISVIICPLILCSSFSQYRSFLALSDTVAMGASRKESRISSQCRNKLQFIFALSRTSNRIIRNQNPGYT